MTTIKIRDPLYSSSGQEFERSFVNTHPGLFAVKADKKAEEEKRQREEDERLYREVEIRELSARFDFSTSFRESAISNRHLLRPVL